MCSLGSRMFFNLKGAPEYGVNVGTNWSSHSQGSVQLGGHQGGESQSRACKLLLCSRELFILMICFLPATKMSALRNSKHYNPEIEGNERRSSLSLDLAHKINNSQSIFISE